MIFVLVFAVVQVLASTYAITRGGMPERIVAGLLLVAAGVSLGVGKPADQYRTLDTTQLAVDLVLLAALLLVAARANRFWPLWICALHLLAIGIHLIRAVDPAIVPWVYWWMIGKIAYPICLALVLGTWHLQRRTRLQGVRPADWSALRW